MDLIGIISQVVFFLVAALTLAAAFATVLLRNVFHAGLALVGTFFGVAAIYLMLEAEFLAIVQVLIYIGAIAVLILFAIMLTRSLMKNEDSGMNKQWAWAAIAISTLFLGMFIVILQVPWLLNTSVIGTDIVPFLGTELLTTYLLPFEIVSVLLLATLIGAFIIARE
ncbi:MAG: NADH-quinone oxidoreductase subunit J [Chloroflexota bacterium]|nr:MAG: NADH-quinone oxidoreductase subunit J [Chloroflexota bacterium]